MSQVDEIHFGRFDVVPHGCPHPGPVAECPLCRDEPRVTCRLCVRLIENRRWTINAYRERITELEAEIAEVERGERHSDYHQNFAAAVAGTDQEAGK